MLQPIEPQLLDQITGGSARVTAHARGDKMEMLQMMMASLSSAIQALSNKPDPMATMLPAIIAMKKGDKKGAIMALMGGKSDDKKSA